MAEQTNPIAAAASLPQLVLELRDLLIAYFKQETIVPLKSLGRYIAFGVLGSLFLGLGATLLAVGELRLLQTETGDTFAGDWSWVSYGIVAVTLVVGAVLVWAARGARTRSKEKKA